MNIQLCIMTITKSDRVNETGATGAACNQETPSFGAPGPTLGYLFISGFATVSVEMPMVLSYFIESVLLQCLLLL